MLKDRILIVSVGQGGGNIGRLLSEKGYFTYFINTSNDDLDSLYDVKDDFKFHIPNAFGCSKNRKKALFFAKDYHSYIMDAIDARFPRQDIVFFVFTLGGGTGSGLSPLLLDILSKSNPNKKYGAIVALPSNSETMIAQANAIEAFAELHKIDELKSVFVIDNNAGDKFAINSEFVHLFDKLVNITVPDSRGIIDGAELETLMTCKGMTVMGHLDSGYKLCNRIFATYRPQCTYLGLSLSEEVNTEYIERQFGSSAIDIYTGYNNDRDFMVACGIPLFTPRIENLANKIRAKQFDRESNMSMIQDNVISAPVLDFKPTFEEPKQNKNKIDFDNLFKKFL